MDFLFSPLKNYDAENKEQPIAKAKQYVEMPKFRLPEQDGFPVIESLVPKTMKETA